MTTVVIVYMVSDTVAVTEGMGRYFNLTAEIVLGNLGIDVVAEVVIISGSTAKGIYLTHDIIIMIYL